MALIKQFEQARSAPAGYRTEVDCGWRIGDSDGRRLLHLETYGSAARSRKGKTSQAIDLDEAGAAELMRILRAAFPRVE